MKRKKLTKAEARHLARRLVVWTAETHVRDSYYEECLTEDEIEMVQGEAGRITKMLRSRWWMSFP